MAPAWISFWTFDLGIDMIQVRHPGTSQTILQANKDDRHWVLWYWDTENQLLRRHPLTFSQKGMLGAVMFAEGVGKVTSELLTPFSRL